MKGTRTLPILLNDITRLGILVAFIIIMIIFQKILHHIIAWIFRNDPRFPNGDIPESVSIIIKLLIGICILYGIFFLYSLPEELIISVSLVIGIIVALSSYQAIQNFTSGIFIILTRPFRINDLIQIDKNIGIIEEITLNYSRIRTIDNTFIIIPNKNIISSSTRLYNQRKISISHSTKKLELKDDFFASFKTKENIRFVFEFGIPLMNFKKIHTILDHICDQYQPVFGYKPDYFLFSVGHRLEYRFVLYSDNALTILNNFTDFRDTLAKNFY